MPQIKASSSEDLAMFFFLNNNDILKTVEANCGIVVCMVGRAGRCGGDGTEADEAGLQSRGRRSRGQK